MGEEKIKDRKEITIIADRLSEKGKIIVFTNGCFDIIHSGHIKYLYEAKKLGDILIIGLNSDSSIKKIKGEKRPIVNEQERAYVLSALEMVDFIVIFDEETPYELIKAVKPHVLVKGGDWDIEKIVGKDIVESYGGRVLNIPFVEGKSTTNIIERVLDVYAR
ncbi:MAG: D-glycero-beta-D-manno-heptose 1-phosphate adenylyltransferase [Proteobacteria bacterium]|nr:D-glycero-beta-D-manno-heptose 1-phosphate adenylyltransferase [Pseudomonadota bacterium]